MKFGSALEAVKSGERIRRVYWPPGVHIRMFRKEGEVGEFLRVPLMAIMMPDGIYKPWCPNQDDIIEEDWEVA